MTKPAVAGGGGLTYGTAAMYAMAAAFALGLALVAPPVAFALLFSGFAMLTRKAGLHALWMLLASLAIFLTLNLSKVPDNDWGWYSAHYYWLRHLEFDQYIGTRFGQFTIKITEPVYYFIASMLSKLSNGNLAVLTTVVTALVYLPICLTASHLTRSLEQRPFIRVVVEWAVLLAGVSFTLTLHLVRQQVGGGFLFLGVFLAMRGRTKWAVFFVLLSILTHNAIALPVMLFVAVFLLSRWLKGKTLVVLSIGAGGLLGATVVFLALVLNYYTGAKSDGEVSILTQFFDIVLFAVFLRAGRRGEVLSQNASKILTALVVAYFSMLLILSPLPIPYLRMYFFMEYFRVIMLLVLLAQLSKHRAAIVIVPVLLFLALGIFSARMARSPFVFGNGAAFELFHPRWAPLFENPLRPELKLSVGSLEGARR